jgi:hypothetical protein
MYPISSTVLERWKSQVASARAQAFHVDSALEVFLLRFWQDIERERELVWTSSFSAEEWTELQKSRPAGTKKAGNVQGGQS